MNKQIKEMNRSLKDTLLERIEEDKVYPRSSWFYFSKECLMWSLWTLSIVIGALAFAVTLFVVLRHKYMLYEATHDNFLTFFISALPYIWILTFALMAAVAVRNFRYTKKGYKYPLWMVLASSIVLSFAGGAALQLFGVGYHLDQALGKYMAMYASQEKQEYKLWQAPQAGRLVGYQAHSTVVPTSTAVFEDKEGNRWRLEIQELHAEDLELLASEKTVRVLGKVTNEPANIFHACGVFPWMLDERVPLERMSKERQAFVARAYDKMNKAEERVNILERETYSSSSPKTMAICAELAAMKRLSKSAER
tara:strand:- start:1599 stop:2522 length:924 start_codon:yes stop_codon:yes gene_type:complete